MMMEMELKMVPEMEVKESLIGITNHFFRALKILNKIKKFFYIF